MNQLIRKLHGAGQTVKKIPLFRAVTSIIPLWRLQLNTVQMNLIHDKNVRTIALISARHNGHAFTLGAHWTQVTEILIRCHIYISECGELVNVYSNEREK